MTNEWDLTSDSCCCPRYYPRKCKEKPRKYEELLKKNIKINAINLAVVLLVNIPPSPTAYKSNCA